MKRHQVKRWARILRPWSRLRHPSFRLAIAPFCRRHCAICRPTAWLHRVAANAPFPWCALVMDSRRNFSMKPAPSWRRGGPTWASQRPAIRLAILASMKNRGSKVPTKSSIVLQLRHRWCFGWNATVPPCSLRSKRSTSRVSSQICIKAQCPIPCRVTSTRKV